MNPFAVEASLHWAAVAVYIGGAVLFACSTLFHRPRNVRLPLWVTAAGLLPHSGALLLRWTVVGHGPYMLKYEVLSSNAWITVVMLVLLVWRRPKWAPVALLALPFTILMMGFGLFANPEARNLPPTLRSMWLVFHVLFNKLAVGAFVLSAGAATALLRKLSGASGRVLSKLPDPRTMEAYTIRLVGFGFVFWSTTIVAGAIWANQSWGRYWGWDPIESWSLVTWLCYGTLLHARRFFRLTPRAVAWGTIACFGVSLLTVYVFPFAIPSLHSAYFQ